MNLRKLVVTSLGCSALCFTAGVLALDVPLPGGGNVHVEKLGKLPLLVSAEVVFPPMTTLPTLTADAVLFQPGKGGNGRVIHDLDVAVGEDHPVSIHH